MTHPMRTELERTAGHTVLPIGSQVAILTPHDFRRALDELDRLHAIVEKMPKCAACNRPCIPVDGMAICSDECYERVAEWGADVKKSMDEYAKEDDNDD